MSIGERTLTAAPQWRGVALFAAMTIATSRGREFTVVTAACLVEAAAGRARTLTMPPVAQPRGTQR